MEEPIQADRRRNVEKDILHKEMSQYFLDSWPTHSSGKKEAKHEEEHLQLLTRLSACCFIQGMWSINSEAKHPLSMENGGGKSSDAYGFCSLCEEYVER